VDRLLDELQAAKEGARLSADKVQPLVPCWGRPLSCMLHCWGWMLHCWGWMLHCWGWMLHCTSCPGPPVSHPACCRVASASCTLDCASTGGVGACTQCSCHARAPRGCVIGTLAACGSWLHVRTPAGGRYSRHSSLLPARVLGLQLPTFRLAACGMLQRLPPRYWLVGSV
jgi:hypothetical protein